MSENQFHFTRSGRLFFTMPKVPAENYPLLCQTVAAQFNLAARGLPTIGLEVIFQNYFRDDQEVGLE